MLMTTLCYIEHNDHYLLLHRTKKEQDINEGKWIGVGGKFLDRESPEDCLLREVKEETGFRLTDHRFRGIVTFLQEDYETEFMCLYTASGFETAEGVRADKLTGASEDWPLPECDEGDLVWIPISALDGLSLWAGDRIFLKLLQEERPFFSLKLRYKGDDLVEVVLDGETIKEPYIK